jgi:hypothetical protein
MLWEGVAILFGLLPPCGLVVAISVILALAGSRQPRPPAQATQASQVEWADQPTVIHDRIGAPPPRASLLNSHYEKTNPLAAFDLGFMYTTEQLETVCIMGIAGDLVTIEYVGTNYCRILTASEVELRIRLGIWKEKPGQRVHEPPAK